MIRSIQDAGLHVERQLGDAGVKQDTPIRDGQDQFWYAQLVGHNASIFLHVTYNYCSRTQFLLLTPLQIYGSTYPTFLDSESSDVQFIFVNSQRFFVVFSSVVCGFPLVKLTNIDKLSRLI